MSILSERLKQLREEKELMQKEIASFLNISTSAYGFYEQDKRTPTPDVLSKLADYFNVSVDYLLGKTNTRNSSSKDSTPPKREQKDHDTFMEDAKALFMNGELDEDDKEKIFKDISDLFWESKKINKEKHSKKK